MAAVTDTTAAAVVALTRHERDLVHAHVYRELDSLSMSSGMRFDSEEAIEQSREWFREVVELGTLLDEIGWESEGTEDSYEVDLLRFWPLITDAKDYESQCLADDITGLAQGLVSPDYRAPGQSVEEFRERQQAMVDRNREAAETLAVAIARLRPIWMERDRS